MMACLHEICCLFQSEAGGERSTSESSINGVWQGDMLIHFRSEDSEQNI